MIPDYALPNFEPKDTDDKRTALNKLFLLNYDKLMKQMQEKQKQEEFNRKYNEIKMLQKDKTAKGELELQLAIEEFVNEYK